MQNRRSSRHTTQNYFDKAVAIAVSLFPLGIPWVIYNYTYMFSSTEIVVATTAGFIVNVVWLLVYPAWWLTRRNTFSLLLFVFALTSSVISFWLLSDPWQCLGDRLGAP